MAQIWANRCVFGNSPITIRKNIGENVYSNTFKESNC